MSGVKSADTLHVTYAGITGPKQEKPTKQEFALI